MEQRDGMLRVGTVEERVEAIASGAHGVVTRQELADAGVTPEEIRRRVHKGALLPIHPGVYRVGHRAPSTAAQYMAAVKACGPRAFLCGAAAAHLFGLLNARQPIPEVTAPAKRHVKGVRTHRSGVIDSRDLTRWRGIPVTTVPRTLVDLAASLSAEELGRACHQAEVRYRLKPPQVLEVLDRRPTSKGARTLRRILFGDLRVTLSRLESRFLSLLEEVGLPLPETNRPAGGRRVDCRWPRQQLTVELDSYRYHGSRHAWELDRRREREAYARGDEFRRYTYGDVFERSRLMMAELRGLLAQPPAKV
jgi:phosphoribosylcarboxyaminoimidazole (NCAIR) mutase